MIRSKLVAYMAAIAFVLGAATLGPARAAAETGEASSPKSPIKVSLVDYVKEGEGPGTLKLSGTAIAGSDVYIYVDDRPFAQVIAAEGDGGWSAEDKIDLDDKVHSVRVEQFDEKTRILAGRAQFNISLSKPSPEDSAVPPGAKP